MTFRGCGSGNQTSKQENNTTTNLQILATSDLHGKFGPWDYALDEESKSGSVAQLSTAIQKIRTANNILVDAGDTIQDNSADIFLDDDIHPMISAMNSLQHDVWVTGNHEYNYGMDTLKKVIKQQKAKVLTGNVYDANGTPLDETKKVIKEIEDQTDVLIAVEHIGIKNEYGVEGSGAEDLAKACPELDVIVAAHEHQQVA